MWELYALRNHYNHKIRTLVSKFEKNFLKSKELEISGILNLNDEDLLNENYNKSNFYFNYKETNQEIVNNIGNFLDELI